MPPLVTASRVYHAFVSKNNNSTEICLRSHFLTRKIEQSHFALKQIRELEKSIALFLLNENLILNFNSQIPPSGNWGKLGELSDKLIYHAEAFYFNAARSQKIMTSQMPWLADKKAFNFNGVTYVTRL